MAGRSAIFTSSLDSTALILLCSSCVLFSPAFTSRGFFCRVFLCAAWYTEAMKLRQTQVATPQWVAAQEPAQWLTAGDLATLAAWPSALRRREWLAGRLAAKRLLAEAFGVPPLTYEIGREGVAPCVIGWHGPPLILSLSHCQGLGAASWSDAETEGTVGIDAQRIRPVHPGLCRRVFTPAEQAQIAARFGQADDPAGMLLFWAAKEAAIKARRVPWGRALREIEVALTGETTAVIEIAGEPGMTAEWVSWEDWWLVRAMRPVGL